MLIQAGFDIAFQCRDADADVAAAQRPSLARGGFALARRDPVRSPFAMGAYLDLFGNRVTRVDVPPGLVTFSNRFTISDSGEPDETPPTPRLTPIGQLPDAVLLFLVPAAIATATNSPTSPGRRSATFRRLRGG